MSRRGTVFVLALVLVAAGLLAWLDVSTHQTELPEGSSHATQGNGAEALYLWLDSLGVPVQRLDSAPESPLTSLGALFVVQPVQPLDNATRSLFEAIPGAGGTLVIAGSTTATGIYLRDLGISARSIPPVDTAQSTDDNSTVSIQVSSSLQAQNATPLLVTSGGATIALRLPYHGGTLVALATDWPLTNDGLRDPTTAAWVYRAIVGPLVSTSAPVAFDEMNFAIPTNPEPSEEPSFGQLLWQTWLGRAALATASLTFLYLLLGSRRLGPAVPAQRADTANRTLYEQVGALAQLYQRAHKAAYARQALGRSYRRAAERVRGSAAHDRCEEAIQAVEQAPNDRALLDAVRAAEEILHGTAPRRGGRP